MVERRPCRALQALPGLWILVLKKCGALKSFEQKNYEELTCIFKRIPLAVVLRTGRVGR